MGTTRRHRLRLAPITVHPHVRGDNAPKSGNKPGKDGSPPRAWGQRRMLLVHDKRCRFTPTCVGTTQHANTMLSGVSGSPPRAWGQLPPPAVSTRQPRFTPTCVGTTLDHLTALPVRSVHPHVRGDNHRHSRRTRDDGGSPPRAWGQLVHHYADVTITRFTPTCVGTTQSVPSQYAGLSVHPHVRGDNDVSAR